MGEASHYQRTCAAAAAAAVTIVVINFYEAGEYEE